MPLQSDALISEGKVDYKSLRTQLAIVPVTGTYTLTSASEYVTQFTGSSASQITVVLPDTTTLLPGWRYEVFNNSRELIYVQDASGALLGYLGQNQFLMAVVLTNATAAGTWSFGVRDFTSGMNKVYGTTLFDDFLGPVIAAAGVGNSFWLITQTNGTFTSPGNLDANHPGTFNMAVTANAAFGTITQSSILIGAGQYTFEALFRIGTLATTTNNYIFQCGLGAGIGTAADATSGIFFEYSLTASTAFRFRVGKSSTYTNTISTTTVTANTWYKVRFVTNPAATSIAFFISAAGGGDVIAAGTVTTNIPTTIALYPYFQIRKTAAPALGAVANSVDVDYALLDYNLVNYR